MKLTLFASLCATALLTSPAFAQGSDAPQATQPAVTAPAPAQPGQGDAPQTAPAPSTGGQASPAAPAASPAPQQAAAAGGSQGRPANLCNELVTFLTPKPAPEGTQANAAAPGGAAQPQPAASGSPQQPSQGSGGQASGGPVPQGAAGPAVEAAQAPQPKNDTAPERSGITAPIPKAEQNATPVTQDDLARAQSLAEANDFRGCKEMAQRLRLAGKPLPPAVIALAGLSVETLERARMP
ncbi:hypothetical protein [Microvirga massiliensis]|uniref:hypothetical protein n=1 Tax=Microvirga massiliensis TaxID=1033741 RepID=UPI00062BAC4F|nr:hypothetical protein [Microvirga massiliensis]